MLSTDHSNQSDKTGSRADSEVPAALGSCVALALSCRAAALQQPSDLCAGALRGTLPFLTPATAASTAWSLVAEEGGKLHAMDEWIDRLAFSRSTQNLICNDRDATQAHRTEVSRHRPAARRGGRNAGWLVPEHARRRARHGRFLIESGVTRAGRRPPGRPAEPKLKRPTKSGVANMRRPKSKLLKRLYLPQSSLMNKVNPFPDRVHDICPSSYNPRTCRIIGSEW